MESTTTKSIKYIIMGYIQSVRNQINLLGILPNNVYISVTLKEGTSC